MTRLISKRTRVERQTASQSDSGSGDISSEEESGSDRDFQPTQSSDSSSDDSQDEEEEKSEAFSKFLKNMKDVAQDDLTDDEPSDLPEWREDRRANKQTWEEEVAAAMGVEDARPAGVFQPDQESKVFLHRFFLHPLLKKYGSYNKLSNEGKKELREQILLGISKKIRVASTVQLYTSALKKMMGIAQSVEIEEGRGDRLPNGRLQYWQLFFFKTEYHYRI